MGDKDSFLRDCVITIMADDFESFEIIFRQTKHLAVLKGMDVNENEVAEAIERAIDDGYADAYILSPQSPHSRKVEYAPDMLYELWFYVTQRGKCAAKSIPDLSGESHP